MVDNCEHLSEVDLGRLDMRIKRNYISVLQVSGSALWSPEFSCMKLNEKIEDIKALFENSNYIDDPGCVFGILLTAVGPQNGVFVALLEKNIDSQQREKF